MKVSDQILLLFYKSSALPLSYGAFPYYCYFRENFRTK